MPPAEEGGWSHTSLRLLESRPTVPSWMSASQPSGDTRFSRGSSEAPPKSASRRATPKPVARSPACTGAAMSRWTQTPGQSKPMCEAMKRPAQELGLLSRSATEFFMSATAEVNSLKCSSGQ